jgi:hypothetical protein
VSVYTLIQEKWLAKPAAPLRYTFQSDEPYAGFAKKSGLRNP